MNSEFHQSVLLNEVLEGLRPDRAHFVVDGTLGAGGHAKAMLERMPEGSELLGLDQDPAALEIAEETLKSFGKRVMLLNENYRNLVDVINAKARRKADAILLDLGLSSMQIDTANRGFSFQTDAPLDMRMNPAAPITAKIIINQYSEKQLLEILWTYGEERFAKQIVKKIINARHAKPIESTRELASIIFSAVPPRYRHGRIHPATRTFQALRIAVNDELGALEQFLKTAMETLAPGGRLGIISFHSLEDRIVKLAFRAFKEAHEADVLTKKPVMASDAEVEENPRARSAKLRVIEKKRVEEGDAQ